MRNSVSFSLSDSMLKQLKDAVKQEGATQSEIARAALRNYFYRRDFIKMRQKMMMSALSRGKRFSEDDIFREVS